MAEEEFEEYLEDLMSELSIAADKKKLIVFRPLEANIDPLSRVVRKKLGDHVVFKLVSKYNAEPIYQKRDIVRSLAWMLSLDRSEKLIEAAMRLELDEAFSYLIGQRATLLSKLKDDEDWIYVKEWATETEEHRLLKLLVYKTLKQNGFTDDEIKVEEVCVRDQEGKPIEHANVPDVRAEGAKGKIWVEVETLRGCKDPRDLVVQEKYQRKVEHVLGHDEFWLVIPSFEIMMHYRTIRTLIRDLFHLFKRKVLVALWRPDLVNRRILKVMEARSEA